MKRRSTACPQPGDVYFSVGCAELALYREGSLSMTRSWRVDSEEGEIDCFPANEQDQCDKRWLWTSAK